MAKDGVVWDLAVTLQELFRSRVSAPDGRPVNFAIDVPSGDPREDAKPLVYLCVYEIEENVQFRKMERALVATVEEDGDLYEYYQFPPLALQLRFLLTCFANTREDEHRILGQLLRIIHDHPVLQGDGMVKGDSVAPDEKVQLAVRSPFGIDVQSRFWLAAGQRFRPAVACQLSVYLDSGRRDRVMRVKEKVVDVKRTITGS
jgi:Pvc16 N-terminal domain